MEKWLYIPGYEGFYQASNTGKIRSVDREVIQHSGSSQTKKGKELSQCKDRLGYMNVALSRDNKLKSFKVHRLVAMTWIVNLKEYKEVNHKDCNKENNSVSNLEWCSRTENIKHAVKNKLIKYHNGDNHHNTILKEKDRVRIRALFNSLVPVSAIAKEYKLHLATIYRSLKKI